MEKRIDLEKRGRKPWEITEFVLDNCHSTTIVGLTDEFVALESLSLNNVGLTSLKGFPKLPNLKKLELSDNRISSGLNLLHTSPKLTSLNLTDNKIKDLDTLQPLKELKNLQYLDLFGNEATNIDNYREKVFSLIPSLQFLDGYEIDDCNLESGNEDDEVNGNDEDGDANEDDSDELSDEDDDEDLEDGGTLEDVYKDLDDDSDEEDYVVENEEDDDEDFDEDDEEHEEQPQQQQQNQQPQEASSSPARGKKRKHEDGVESEN